MSETLTLNDGTVLAGHANESDDVLYVYLENTVMAAAYPYLSDPEKTRRITANRFGVISEYVGYNHLKAISEEAGGMVSAVIRKAVIGNG
jgi:hypothetical protein